MIGRISLVLLLFSAVSAAGQSHNLPRVDQQLGDFVITESLALQCRGVQLAILQARSLDLPLDRYLLRWEFTNRGDPFGMALPYQNEPKVEAIFEQQNVGVGDCMFFQTALSRAAADLLELQLGHAKLKGARLANARFLATHDYMLQPTVEMRAAQEVLVRDRQQRVR